MKFSLMANRLKKFVGLTIEKEENTEVKSDLYNNWRIVNGESKSTHSYLFAISTMHIGEASK
ncbi:hypothetical protein [Rossellomorea sp. NS-SX7]|uniref:hypothetical protein n=1 Tax=Rossellomorea sp. NS-SX7 TaxID=3463856 RepID=UPI004058DF7B